MYTVRLNGQDTVFGHVQDLRRYVIRNMSRYSTCSYDGHGRGYSHNRGEIFYNNGWKVKTAKAVYSIESDGSITKLI